MGDPYRRTRSGTGYPGGSVDKTSHDAHVRQALTKAMPPLKTLWPGSIVLKGSR